MSDRSQVILISTTLTSFFTGFLLGIYSIRGYLISPELASERAGNYKDPVESEESDVDEDDTILDHAPNWSNGEDADRRQGLRAPKEVKQKVVQKPKEAKKAVASEEDGNPGEECKLVLVVRTDLGMTKGKMAAQCGHATLACYKTLLQESQKNPSGAAAKLLKRWERHGQAKIAVQTKSQDEMLELMGKARSLGVTAEVIADAGRTQIDAGSLTVLGVGPAPKSVVDKITGHLKLL
ncbi:PTH2-domain-containing protein [Coniochaeta ligniaria NRRL 30616]|uniref:peptidyl-tRNA hydrolase n=1 Tax=Coniochaeta ligniaria NRRL 30616 TaxID=1408157 RepID=A0A1J7IEM6_9PEZI|nr:PTH2-domain-containing protein [Coniochaeta ligniaria NRRL 30616]